MNLQKIFEQFSTLKVFFVDFGSLGTSASGPITEVCLPNGRDTILNSLMRIATLPVTQN